MGGPAVRCLNQLYRETRGGPSPIEGGARAAQGTQDLSMLLTMSVNLMELPTMNSDQMKGNWKQFVGKAKEKWGRLTNDDFQVVEGKRDQARW